MRKRKSKTNTEMLKCWEKKQCKQEWKITTMKSKIKQKRRQNNKNTGNGNMREERQQKTERGLEIRH